MMVTWSFERKQQGYYGDDRQSDRFAGLRVGEHIQGREYSPDNVQLMLYNAALWNAHRIHFDEPYAKNAEGYPGLVIAGPMLGDWLHQCVEEWLGEDGQIFSIDYSNRVATFRRRHSECRWGNYSAASRF